METVAKIAVKAAVFSIDKPYDYQIPPSLLDRVCPGVRVVVPFGRGNRRSEGFVLALAERDGRMRLKPIDKVLDAEPVLSEKQIKLGIWMHRRFFCTVYSALRAMLPAGIWYKLEHRYCVAPGQTRERAYEAAGKSVHAASVLDALYRAGGKIALPALQSSLGARESAVGLRRLLDAGVVLQEVDESKRVGDMLVRMARLKIPAEDALVLSGQKRKRAPQQAAVLELLAEVGQADVRDLRAVTGASAKTVRSLIKDGILEEEAREAFRGPERQAAAGPPPTVLTGEQSRACEGLVALLKTGRAAAALLHGVTGSGKTAVYIRLIDTAMEQGRSALILVPEISLTPQMTGVFIAKFGDRVAVLHSALAMGERYDEWKRIRSGQVRVVVGTRSAVFAPLEDLGLVIMDEEQEHTYKSDNVPRYHTRDVAKYRCGQSGALLLLGSATPSVESMYSAQAGAYHYFTLETRYNRMELPDVRIVDMKTNLRQGGSQLISRTLEEEISKNLESGRQSILFLNRRGTSGSLICGECGFVHRCRRCSVSLTYHGVNERLLCHYCGYSEKKGDACPECGGIMKQVGAGTQKAEQELKALFPDAALLRMDTDTVTGSHSHEEILHRFEAEKIPILVGTQMVTKGLDFEAVTLVGVLAADEALYAGDYRAQERAFSLITQVVGRAGRGRERGRAVIQTYTPDHEVIRLAAKQDYYGFYQREIELRRVQECPPARDLIAVIASGLNESAVLQCCVTLKQALASYLKDTQEARVLGPAPHTIVRLNNRYRYRVTLRCRNNKMIRDLIAHVIRKVSEKKEYRGVTIYADIDPMD